MGIKIIENTRYRISFNTETGEEILEGINGELDPFILDYPSLIDVGIMGHCENKCIFCYQGDEHQDHMSLDNFKRIVDESKFYVNQLACGGRGDPNKHPNFKEILKYCRDNNVVPNYTTSGIDLTEEEVEITKEFAGAVAVSMHRQDYTWRALKMFMDAEMKTNIHFVFSNYSAHEAFKLLKMEDPWNGKVDLDKLHAIIFLLFKKQGSGLILDDWVPYQTQLQEFSNLIENVTEDNLRYFVGCDSCMINKLLKLKINLTKEQMESIDSCEGARMSCYISPDMKFIPCSFGGKLRGESILNKSIKDVWDNGIEFNKFRDCLCKDAASCPYEL